MADSGARVPLIEECRIFTRYLIDREPAPDVVAAYARGHDVGSVTTHTQRAMDRALLRVAHLGPRWARGADGFAALFAKSSVLRRKLVLLVAILESRGETADLIDTATPGSITAWVVAVAAAAAASIANATVAALLILPLCVWYGIAGAEHAGAP